MSAIAGIVRFDHQADDRVVLARMQAMLTPYGADAQRHWQHEGVGLLHTLLRSTPEDSLDRQPLKSADGTCVLLFDGRLDNRRELADKLGLSAADMTRLADSDLVLQACLKWDTDAVKHLYGAYALACWQPRRRRLWLARDPTGQRPLFWHRQTRFFAFASLPKALFCIPGVTRELCELRLLDHLALLPLKGPESFFKDIYRIEPGHLLIVDGDRVVSQRFHRFEPRHELKLARDSDYLEAFQEHLEQAVSNCLRTSGPIASQLSSGFDSSTVTALAARQLGRRNQRLTAFTAAPREGFHGPVPAGRHGDESVGARALATRFTNIDHVLVRTADASVLNRMAMDIENMDRAYNGPSNMTWVNAIYDRARALGCKVLLTGQMGNVSISYTGETHLAGLLRHGKILSWWRELNAYHATHPHRRRSGLIAKSIAPSLPRPLWALLARQLDRNPRLTDYSAINAQWMKRMDVGGRARMAKWDLSYQPWHDGRHMRIATIERIDPGEYFMAANLHGMEVRDPSADQRLLEFCLSVPDHQYLRHGQTRWLLRRMMADILPAEILSNTSKGYQAADWYETLARDLPMMREQLRQLSTHSRVKECLDVEALQQLLDNWPEHGWETPGVIRSYRLKLLRGLSAASFIRYIEPDNH